LRRVARTLIVVSTIVIPAAAAAQTVELPRIDVTTQPRARPSAAAVPPRNEPANTAAQPQQPEALGAASERIVSGERVNENPVTRPGEILENAAPGLIVTQHSGEGKANQYFLRGFNLDHGTDLAITVDGMPVNMRTHGHGQGYADLNFLIPELIGSIRVRKGPYFADEGDFSSAGAIHIDYLDSLKHGFAQATTGSFGYNRLLAARSSAVGAGTLLAAVEANTYNGPWQVPDEVRKFNGLVRYSQGSADNGFSILGLGYTNKWTSTDQVAQRGRQRPDRPLRLARSERWRQIEPRQPVGALGPHRGQRADSGRSLRHPPEPDAVQQLHLFPRRSGQRRPVQPDRPAHGDGRQREPYHQGALRPVRYREHNR
jgi:hypothetical protein